MVILDIIMPNESGIEVLSQLMSYDSNAKIIMCTSSATQEAVITAIKLGAKHFLVKPVEINSLVNTLHALQMTGQL